MHWSLAIAQDIVSKRKEQKHVVATGITPSGAIHVGNLREIITGDAVYTALRDMGVDARLIYIADTFDPLRRRYPFLPPEYEAHVGKPLTEIPDPEGRLPSYADHFLQPFLRSLDELGIKIEVFRADELYKSGRYVEMIKEALVRKEKVSRVIKDVSGRELPEDWSPFNPLCEVCGRINAAVVKGYDLEKEEVYYECKCGHTGVASFTGGGKLAWRVDWAARWKILGVTIEPFGKDHASPGGSFDTGTRLSEEIYAYPAPYPIPFEHILLKLQDEGTTKAKVTAMSSSRGTNIPVHEIIEAVPPVILKYVISKVRPEKHIEFNPSLPLLNLIDEYEREIGSIGRGIAGTIPFRHFITLVQVARGDPVELLTVVNRSGYALFEEYKTQKGINVRSIEEEEIEEIRKKARYAANWLRTYAPENVKFDVQVEVPTEELNELAAAQKEALRLMTQALQTGANLSAADWHDKVYEIASTVGTEPKEVFKAIYIALLGKSSGPRAGWLLASLETKFLKDRFESAADL